ncbi:hypothetical protein SHL15_3322 [Streptomyces hygroscopicus subsp. limoneus]|nr:hypothetical protein SHL15_3322 [Streptomyces hygroscopicus subsp. limoneus]
MRRLRERLGEPGLPGRSQRPHGALHGRPPLTSDDLIAWSRRETANYKVPRSVEFVPTLPRNTSGKVLKGELRELRGRG